MAVWWVNQNQTLGQEIDGGYLWSPKRNKNGARNQFYENMKAVEPGDLILSFANQKISYVGVAQGRAATEPKPSEFGQAGQNWSLDGWMVDVVWRKLQKPVKPKDLIETLRPLLPEKYSPIQQSGDGNQGVYLAEVPAPMAEALFAFSSELQIASLNALEHGQSAIERSEQLAAEVIINNTDIDSTTREALIQSRKGQGRFRANVFQIEVGCRLTGVTDFRILRASHIKPWRQCDSNHERLDGHNGLLLTPTFDLLFDQGYLSFQDSGALMISERIDNAQYQKIGLPTSQVSGSNSFNPQQMRYLSYHRTVVFR